MNRKDRHERRGACNSLKGVTTGKGVTNWKGMTKYDKNRKGNTDYHLWNSPRGSQANFRSGAAIAKTERDGDRKQSQGCEWYENDHGKHAQILQYGVGTGFLAGWCEIQG